MNFKNHHYIDGVVQCKLLQYENVVTIKQSAILVLQARQCDTTIVFMQDGAPSLSTRCMKQVLRRHLDDNRISRHFLTAWSPRSSDLNPCYILLWGYRKAMVYRDPITSSSDIKAIFAVYTRA
ncbi:uncharacterized protein TNCV_5032191 [Trichonephila clavipes]|nr:uncharacterized protein TNCV_5032191 [Trichonephila clavipes]